MPERSSKQLIYQPRPRRWLRELLQSYAERDPPRGLTVLQATVQVLLDNTDLPDAAQAELYERLDRDSKAPRRKMMRGMSMREMKARQQGRAPRMSPTELPELALEVDEATESEEYFEPGQLVDQGDGMHVSARRERVTVDERPSYEYPDEPPPGWLEEA